MKKIAVAAVIVIVLSITLSVIIERRGAAATSDAEYVAGKTCRMCHHSKTFKAHAKTYHARSFENLTNVGEEANPKCLPCHTTGYGDPGGLVDVASTADLAGITCQACHGPGRAHVAKGLNKEQRRQAIQKIPRDACTKCHMTHKPHPDIGIKALPALKKKLEKIQARIDELGG